MKNKILKSLTLILMGYGLMSLFSDLHKRYEHYQAIERFDQVESILRKGQKVDL